MFPTRQVNKSSVQNNLTWLSTTNHKTPVKYNSQTAEIFVN